MDRFISWSAVLWTFRGALCALRFFWVSPFHMIQASPRMPNDTKNSDPLCKFPAGGGKLEKPHHQERSGAVHKRLCRVEGEIQTLKSQIASERASWERRFLQLQIKQRELRDQLMSDTFPGVFLDDDEGCNYDIIESEVQNCPLERAKQDLGVHITSLNAAPRGSQASSLSSSGGVGRPLSVLSTNTSIGSSKGSCPPHRAFVPHSPLDLQIGQRIRILLPSGRVSTGTLRYLGQVGGGEDLRLGVELEWPEPGLQDGAYQGQSYFKCEPGHGAFVTFNKLLMAWE